AAGSLLEGRRQRSERPFDGRLPLRQGAAEEADAQTRRVEHLLQDPSGRRTPSGHSLLDSEGGHQRLLDDAAYALSRRGDGIQSLLSRRQVGDATQLA